MIIINPKHHSFFIFSNFASLIRKCYAKWGTPCIKMDRVYKLADEGNGYLAIGRANVIVRKLLKDKKTDDAMIFLMNLSFKLISSGEYRSAGLAAYRALSLFPLNSRTIRSYLKILFFQFVEKHMTKEVACPEVFKYCNKLCMIFMESSEMILNKEIEVAIGAEMYGYAQSFLIRMLFIHKADSTENETVKKTLVKLKMLLINWFEIYEIENKYDTGMFILARCLLMIAGIRLHGLDFANYLLKLLEMDGKEELDKMLKTPLVNFAKLYLKALDLRSEPTLKYLLKKYKPLLDYDQEIYKWCEKSKKVQMNPDRDGDATDIESLMGLLNLAQQQQQNQ